MSKRAFFVVAGFAVVAILIAVFALRGPAEKVKVISGRLKSVDIAARSACLEVVHPKTGETLQVDGRVPLECDIRIDDRRAALADLRPGEWVEVEGVRYRDNTLSAIRVRATRTSVPTSGPAAGTQPISGRPAVGQAASAPTTGQMPPKP